MKSHSTIANRRQASILVCVLVCLAVATALVTSTVRSALDARRAMRTQHQLRQTELLLAAGVERAAQQLQATADYSGETWTLSPTTIPGMDSAQVQIDLSPADDDSSRTVNVTARLSVSELVGIQRSYSFTSNSQLSSDQE